MQAEVSNWLTKFKSNSENKSAFHNPIKISITGGKGGVGKTSISVKFAKELAAQGNRVLLIDCDYNLSNTAIKLGLPITNTFWSLLSLEKDFDDCLYKDGSFHLLSACNGSLDLFDSKLKLEEIIIDIINSHQNSYDFILLDCPAGLSRESLTLNAYCDSRFVVVTPDKSSLTDSYSLIKVLNSKFGITDNHLIVNQYTTKKQYEKIVKTLSETVENFLNCRTHILGGVRKIDVFGERFDTFFLHNKENETHRNFLKVIKKYTDQLGMPTSVGALESVIPKAGYLEHEVQGLSC